MAMTILPSGSKKALVTRYNSSLGSSLAPMMTRGLAESDTLQLCCCSASGVQDSLATDPGRPANDRSPYGAMRCCGVAGRSCHSAAVSQLGALQLAEAMTRIASRSETASIPMDELEVAGRFIICRCQRPARQSDVLATIILPIARLDSPRNFVRPRVLMTRGCTDTRMRRIQRIDLCSDEPNSCGALLIAAIASIGVCFRSATTSLAPRRHTVLTAGCRSALGAGSLSQRLDRSCASHSSVPFISQDPEVPVMFLHSGSVPCPFDFRAGAFRAGHAAQ